MEELKDLAEAGAPAMPIGKGKAMDIAMAEFGKASSAEILHSEVDPELDESPAHYEVEITGRNGEEIEYKIDAYSGAVIAVKREMADDEASEAQPTKPAQPETVQDIGHAKAKSIALNHAGVDANTVYDMNIQLDVEDGTIIYEVEFKSGNIEYDYEIDAATGAILRHETELDD